jgi:putative peptidoglycan binding protein
MKTKFYALVASLALIAQAQAGDRHGGGGGHSAPSASAPARSGGGRSFHSGPMRNFGGGRGMYSGRRFAPVGIAQFNRGNFNRGEFTRFGNNPRFAEGRNNPNRHNGVIGNHRNGGGQVRSGNNLPGNWRNHVVTRHSGNWHRDWDRGRDHRWHGHHCRFINGSWVIFDFGFNPWWSYGYPGGYYGYDYYPYDYDPGYYYDSSSYDDGEYYGQSAYGASVPDTESPVAAAQERLADEGYYHGEIDGILGPQTQRGIARYQTNHGLRVTGDLTTKTLQALGLRQVASN